MNCTANNNITSNSGLYVHYPYDEGYNSMINCAVKQGHVDKPLQRIELIKNGEKALYIILVCVTCGKQSSKILSLTK